MDESADETSPPNSPKETPEEGPSITIIAPDGDVMLVVGQGPEQRRLRVYSTSLGAASKVFKVMFCPRWPEGQKLSSTNPKEVELPEDDPDAMKIICYVLHWKNNLIPSNPKPEAILSVYFHVVKYDLLDAMKFFITSFLTVPLDLGSLNFTDKGHILAVAFMIKDEQSFARVSYNMIANHCDSFATLCSGYKQIREILPPNTFCLLEERRTMLRTRIFRTWSKWIDAACQKICERDGAPGNACDWGRGRMEKFERLREKYWKDDPPRVPNSVLMRESEDYMTGDMEEKVHCRISSCPKCNRDHGLPYPV